MAGRPLKHSSHRIHLRHKYAPHHIVRRLYRRPRTRVLPEPRSSCRLDCQRMALERRILGLLLPLYSIVERCKCSLHHTRHYSGRVARRPTHSENLRAHTGIHHGNLWDPRRSSNKSSDQRRRHTHHQFHIVDTLANHSSHQEKYLRCIQTERHTSSLHKRHRDSLQLERLHNSARCYIFDPHRSPDHCYRAGYILAPHFALQAHTDIRHDTPKSRCMA